MALMTLKTVFPLTALMSRLQIRDQRPSEPIPAKFGPIRRDLHLQDAVDDADGGVPVHRINEPTLDS